MTAAINTPNESTRGWVVDVATHRIVRRDRPAPAARQEKDDRMTTQDLNPLEDIKGAARYVEGLNPVKALKEALETGAELLEPAEADPRALELETDTVSETVEPAARHGSRPTEAHPLPDSRDLSRRYPRP